MASKIGRGFRQTPYNAHAMPFEQSILNSSNDGGSLKIEKIPVFQIFPWRLKKKCHINSAVGRVAWLASIVLLLVCWHWLSIIFWQSSSVLLAYRFLRVLFWGVPDRFETNIARPDNVTREYPLNELQSCD